MSEKKEETFEIDIAEDLMAAALAAVDARFKPKKPSQEEMDSFAGDLVIEDDLDEDFDEGEDFDEDEFELEIEIGATSSDGMLEDVTTDETQESGAATAVLENEVHRLQTALDQSLQENTRLKKKTEVSLGQLRKNLNRSERDRDKIKHLLSDVKNALDARSVAESRVKALRQTVEKLQTDLQDSLSRRRRDLDEQRERDTSKIVTSFLPVVDNLQLALQHAEANPSTLVQGVQMVMGQFLKTTATHGVMPIPSNPGTLFDPHLHEAVEMVEDPDWEPNTIVSTIQVGYQQKRKLIRAARVIVSKGPVKASPVVEDLDDFDDDPDRDSLTHDDDDDGFIDDFPTLTDEEGSETVDEEGTAEGDPPLDEEAGDEEDEAQE